MLRGLFITGTDTNIGKTVVSAALMHRYRNEIKLRYWKPIQTGIENDDDTAAVRELGKCADGEILDEGVRLKHSVAPELAAQLNGNRIELRNVCLTLLKNPLARVSWIIEGAGGALVPVNDHELMVDFPKALALPVLIVAGNRLGTINHTLLTIEALRKRALVIAGVVLVGARNEYHRSAIESHGAVTVFGEMPHFDVFNSQVISKWAQTQLDPAGQLLDHLRLAHHPRLDAAS
jgi:dethiobiotin synthase